MSEEDAEVQLSRELRKEEAQNHAERLIGEFTGVLNKNKSYKNAETAYDHQEQPDIYFYENGIRYDVEIGGGYLHINKTQKEGTPEVTQKIVQLQDPSQDPTGKSGEAIVAFQSPTIFTTQEGNPNRQPVRNTSVALEEAGKFLKELDADLIPKATPT